MDGVIRFSIGLSLIALVGTGCVATDVTNLPTNGQSTEKEGRVTRIPAPAAQPIDVRGGTSNEKTAHDNRSFAYFKSAPEFELVCTSPCKVDDRAFLDAFFVGMQKGILSLKEATGGVMPKQKIEYHAGKDDHCFKNGYGEHPTGYVGYVQGKSLICGSDYYWYQILQGTSEARNLSSYRTIEHQTLTIHESIHHIFNDYTTQGFSAPDYAIQESFAKVVSLYAVGTLAGYDDENFLGGYTIENPPPRNDNVHRSNFFVYSLNKRFGFKPEHTKIFFQRYSELSNIPMLGNNKVKMILDEILGVDVQRSFNDIHIDILE